VQGAIPGFVPVDQQQAWTVEIGSRGRSGAVSWDVTAYHARLRDELLNFTVTPDIPASTFNAEDTVHQGLEIGLGWQATEELSFQGIYNLNDFYFDGNRQFGDNDLAGAPPHQIRLSAKFEKNGAYIEPNVEWIPSAAWVDYANTMKADSFALYGVKAGWDVNENATLFVEGRNLTNEKTIASFSTITDARTAGTGVFYPGDGRSLFAGIKVKF
jgi:iron complex outermembrane receptor protein